MSVPFPLILGFEKHLPAARVRRETSSSALHLVLLLTSSSALPRHRPSIASFGHRSKAITCPRDRKPGRRTCRALWRCTGRHVWWRWADRPEEPLEACPMPELFC
jgi:hypothetical protein